MDWLCYNTTAADLLDEAGRHTEAAIACTG